MFIWVQIVFHWPHSSVETECRSMASDTTEFTWISYILRDIGDHLHNLPILFCDNTTALHMIVNPLFYARKKHIKLDFHFVYEKVTIGFLVTRYVPSTSQIANILTKALSKESFHALQVKLGLQPPPPFSLRGSDKALNTSPCMVPILPLTHLTWVPLLLTCLAPLQYYSGST